MTTRYGSKGPVNMLFDLNLLTRENGFSVKFFSSSFSVKVVLGKSI